MTVVIRRRLLCGGEKIIVHGDDVPKRRINRIKLRLFSLIGEAIRQHAFRDSPSPLQQDIARFSEKAGRDAKPTQRDKRVAPPIAKPRITSDKGFALAPLDEVRIRAAFERR